MKLLTFEELVTQDSTEYREVEAYGGVVRVGSISSKDMFDWSKKRKAAREAKDDAALSRIGLELIVISMVDAQGNRLTAEQREKMVDALISKSAASEQLLVEAILDLNGMTKKEGAANPSKTTSSEGSSSASPSPSVH